MHWNSPLWLMDDSEYWHDIWTGAQKEALHEKGPKIASKSAFIYDLDQSRVLWAYNEDARRPTASMTKLLGVLALSRYDTPLDKTVCLDGDQVPNMSGAGTKYRTGYCTTGWDLIGAALVSSDNGAAMALPGLVGVTHDRYADEMNNVAEELGMSLSSFVDPAGLSDDNLSTSRDMTLAVIAASIRSDIGMAASASDWYVQYDTDKSQKRISSTNRVKSMKGVEVLAAKTGYTHTARHCFTMVYISPSGRHIALTQMGAFWNSERWSDVRKMMDWVERLP